MSNLDQLHDLLAAAVWRALEGGMTPQEILAEVVRALKDAASDA